METLKDIEGFEGLYKISNTGRVYSIKSNKFLKPTISGKDKNRLYIKLYKNNI